MPDPHWVKRDKEPEVIDEAEMAESEREWAEWEATPEGQAVMREHERENARRIADPNRLSNRLEFSELPLIFAQAVQRIYDQTQEPCTLSEAGEAAGMDSSEYIVACAFAKLRGLVRNPTHPDDPSLEAANLYLPAIG